MTLALISIIVLAVIRGVAAHSTNRLAEARDALDYRQTGEVPPPLSGTSSDTE